MLSKTLKFIHCAFAHVLLVFRFVNCKFNLFFKKKNAKFMRRYLQLNEFHLLKLNHFFGPQTELVIFLSVKFKFMFKHAKYTTIIIKIQ